MTINKIFDQSGGDFLVFDGKIRQYSTATHEEELMNSDFIKLSWDATTGDSIPVGSYIVYDGVNYRLFEEYLPTQTGEKSWKYEPQFQHPTMWLKYVPYLHLQGNVNSWASADKKSEWTYSGYVGNLIADLLGFMKLWGENVDSEFGNTFFRSGNDTVDWEPAIDPHLENTVINITFTATDLWSAMVSIAGQLDCEFHFDLVEHKLHLGNVSYRRSPATGSIPLNVGVNVGAPSISRNKEAYCNRYVIHGGTRNMTQQGIDGKGYQATNRLTLPQEFTDSVIDLTGENPGISQADWDAIKADANEPAITGEMDYDDIFPKVKFYIYDLKERVRKRKLENGEYSDEYYSTWYCRLATYDGLSSYLMKDYVMATVTSIDRNSNFIVLGLKNYSGLFNNISVEFTTEMESETVHAYAYVQTTQDGYVKLSLADTYDDLFGDEDIETIKFIKGVNVSNAPEENVDTDRIPGVDLQMSFLPNYEQDALPSDLAGRTFSTVYYETEETEFEEGAEDRPFTIPAGYFRIDFVEENSLIIPQTGDIGVLIPRAESTQNETNNVVSLIGVKAPQVAVTAAKTELLNAAIASIKRKRLNNNTYTLKSYPHNWSEHMPTGNTPLHIGMHVMLINSSSEDFLDTHIRKLVTRLDFPEVQEITIGNEKRKGTISTLKEKVETTVFYGGGSSSTGGGTGNAQTSEMANKANRLADNTPHTVWGQTYWENGKPKDVDGTIDNAEDINMSGTLRIGGFEVMKDANDALKHDGTIYATGGVAALGYTAAGSGGGGGVANLGELLTSLNNELMPTGDGYLHWNNTTSRWEWTTPSGGGDIDLTDYAEKVWVEAQVAATRQWVGQQGFLTEHQSLAAYTPTSQFQQLTVKGGNTTVGTYSPTQSLSLTIAAGTNISVTPDATTRKITIANTYQHPGGTTTEITAANGRVLSAITVSNGHVTSVSSKTLAAADIPDLSGTYLPIMAGGANPLTNSLYVGSATNKGIFLKDPSGAYTPVIYQNSQNLWIGALQTNSTHHRGATYISAGHDGTHGYNTIYVSVPNDANNNAVNYGVWHSGNDGSGSGLDADLLDGHDSGYFATTAALTTLAGTVSSQGGRITTLEGYFENGVAKSAKRLSGTASYTAWGQTYWENGVPKSISGAIQDTNSITPSASGTYNIGGRNNYYNQINGQILCLVDSITNEDFNIRWWPASRTAEEKAFVAMYAWETKMSDICIGSTNPTYGLYFDSAHNRWGIGTDAPSQQLHVVGNIMATGAVSCLGTSAAGSEVTGATQLRDLEDVLITGTPTTGHVLTFNGTKWVPQAAQGGDMSSYATKDWVGQQGYATQQWVYGRGFAYNADLQDLYSYGESAYVKAIGTSGNYLTYTKNGSTTNLTVPFATNADTVDGKHASEFVPKTGFFVNSLQSGSFTPNGIILPLTLQSGGVYALDLSSTLSGYLPLTAGSGKPLTGQLYLDTGGTTEVYVNVKSNRATANGGGWAFPLITARNAAGTNVFTMGAYGAAASSNYGYIGMGGWNSATNLRVYNDGSVSVGNSIKFQGSASLYEMITFIDSGLSEGSGIAIGGGGATIIGGGESAVTMSLQVSGQNERMYIGNDGAVSIFTNLQSGWDYRKEFTFGTNGNLTTQGGVTIKANNGTGLTIVDTSATHDFTAFWIAQTYNNVSREIFTMYSYETKYWDMCIGTHPNAVGYGGLYMYNSGDNALRWGIGTATPSAKLDVNGAAHLSGDGSGYGLILANDKAVSLEDSGGTIRRALFLNANNQLAIGYGTTKGGTAANQYDTAIFGRFISFGTGGGSNTDPAIRMTISSAGNVGIGTTSPQHKLHVAGNVVATGAVSALGVSAQGTAVGAVIADTLQVAQTASIGGATTIGGYLTLRNSATITGNVLLLGDAPTIIFGGDQGDDPAIYMENGHIYARAGGGNKVQIV